MAETRSTARRRNTVPDGWEEVRTDEVALLRKGSSFTSAELVPGDFPVIAGGREPTRFHHRSNRPAGTITVSASGAYAGFVSFHRRPIFAADCTTVVARNERERERLHPSCSTHSNGSNERSTAARAVRRSRTFTRRTSRLSASCCRRSRSSRRLRRRWMEWMRSSSERTK